MRLLLTLAFALASSMTAHCAPAEDDKVIRGISMSVLSTQDELPGPNEPRQRLLKLTFEPTEPHPALKQEKVSCQLQWMEGPGTNEFRDMKVSIHVKTIWDLCICLTYEFCAIEIMYPGQRF